jgi:hypothetical protein
MTEAPIGTKELTYEDEFGRKWRVLIPKASPDSDAEHGLVLGPPDLKPLGLPTEVEIRLHNALEARNIISARDAADRPGEIVRALQAALKVSAQSIQGIYLGG